MGTRSENKAARTGGRGPTAGLFLLLILTAALLPAGRGYSQRMIDLKRVYSNLFPVRVAAVVFDSGSRMDEVNALGFGEWAVRFGPHNPSANYHCDSPCLGSSPPPVVKISGLVCESPDLGETPCDLVIFLRGNQADECAIRGEENESLNIPIDCPAFLEIL